MIACDVYDKFGERNTKFNDYFKCHNSDERFRFQGFSHINIDFVNNDEDFTFHFDHKCKNDKESYQGCVASLIIGRFTSYKNAICQIKVETSGGEVIGKTIRASSVGKQVVLPSGKQTVDSKHICNGHCEMLDCEDEAQCNGFTYGQYCYPGGDSNKQIQYISPYQICSPNHKARCCKSDGHEGYRECKAVAMCNETVPQCYSSINTKYGKSYYENLVNMTRCFSEYICDPALDQTNCSDHSRVGATCPIDGYTSTVSKFRVCRDPPLCDDYFDSLCETASQQCRVHKHQLCDTVEDCAHNIDEKLSICQYQTVETCVRRGGNGILSLPIPLTWLKDGIRDCIDGEDENNWPFCGVGRTQRFVSDHSNCFNVYLCPSGEPGFVEFEQLCDGTDTCGNENEVCRASRGSKAVQKKVNSSRQGLRRTISYCHRGLEQLRVLTELCVSKKFLFPTEDIFGLEVPQITLPNTEVNCDSTFGEQYIYTSCTNKCTNSSCPLTNIPLHDSCPEYYTGRVRTIANNEYLTFAIKAEGEEEVYLNNFFLCDNGYKCISYHQVCDLVDDCEDSSDEKQCTNHFQCKSSRHFIPKTSQCDGKFDCLDFSDECNDECSNEILDGSVLEVFSWTIGLSAVVANVIMIVVSIFSMRKCRTSIAMTNKSLVVLISTGDFLVGAYLLTVSIFDRFVHGAGYCQDQLTWLASNKCNIIGVISTIGSQLSLVAMTLLSIIRAHGIWNSMKIPAGISKKSSIKIIAVNVFIVMSATAIAIFPVLRAFEDFFVNGLRYDVDLKLFIGLVSKETHIDIFRQYFGRLKNSILSWDRIDNFVSSMFSHDEGIKDFTKTREKVGFYGNDGVCLFKYFIRENDPQQVFVWSTLMINFLCFMLISVCYVIIAVLSMRSSRAVSSKNDDRVRKRTRTMNRKITIIITTDFLCWVPFILICVLHYLELVDATPWYSLFSMIILPINSVINPVLYNDIIMRYASRFSAYTNRSVSMLMSSVVRISSTRGIPQQISPQETIEMQERE